MGHSDYLFLVGGTYFLLGVLFIFLMRFKRYLLSRVGYGDLREGAQSTEMIGVPVMLMATLIVVVLWPAFIVLIFVSWLSLLIGWPNGGFEWTEIWNSRAGKSHPRIRLKFNNPILIFELTTASVLILLFVAVALVLWKTPILEAGKAADALQKQASPGASCSAIWLSSMSEDELCEAYWRKLSTQCEPKMARELIERGVLVTPRSSCGKRPLQPMPNSVSITPGASCSSNWISSLSNEEICNSYWENSYAQCNEKLAKEISARGLILSPRAACGTRHR